MNPPVLSLLADPVVVSAFGSAVGILLCVGALMKLRDVELFGHVVGNYGLLTERQARVFARAFPAAELVSGLGLILAPTLRASLPLSLAVLAVASGGVLVNLLRGRTSFDCGCGLGTQNISGGLLLRNLVLAAAIVIGTRDPLVRALGALDYLSCLGMLLGLLGLYVCANQLLSNQQALEAIR